MYMICGFVRWFFICEIMTDGAKDKGTFQNGNSVNKLKVDWAPDKVHYSMLILLWDTRSWIHLFIDYLEIEPFL